MALLAILLTAALLASLSVIAVARPAASSASPGLEDARATTSTPELLSNPDFSDGSSGWRTNSRNETLRVRQGDSPVAYLTTSSTGHAVLNDSPNAVQNTTAGTSYTATARVRTSSPDVNGALRIREVGDGQVTSSETSFSLSDTDWQTVTLEMTTVHPGSHLDLNLVAWNLPSDSNLQVDSVSLKRTVAAVPPNQCDVPPPNRTLFGASISSSGGLSAEESLADIDNRFTRVPVVRHFSSNLPFTWDSRRADLLEDRTVVLSFKVHPTDITSGRHDDFFRSWFAEAPTDQTIYWSYYHEPEDNIARGEFTAAQYRAAWTRLAQMAEEVCKPNLYSTLILMEWTMNPSSGRNYRDYDAGHTAIDVIAFDPYNGASDPGRDYYRDPEDLLGRIASTMAQDGRPWGIAETGSRLIPGDSGEGRAEWLTGIGNFAIDNGALFVTYFQSTSDGDWRLLDAPSVNVWRGFVRR